ncbi:MAG: nucleotidyl transferase AbiEii/AbiGii toxin family protein [Methylococcales bacterium]
MNNTLLNISEKISEPIIKIYDLIAKIANQQNVRFFVIGATARDIVFEYDYNIPAPRATKDIDLAVQVATWAEFQSLKNALIATGQFSETKMAQRLHHQSQIPVDIVPFGAIAPDGKTISWIPDGNFEMSIIGFDDAYQAAQIVRLRDNPVVDIPVATPAALVILKLITWQEHPERGKDATDLVFLLRNYLASGQTDRLAEQHSDLLEGDFDFEPTGARLLGRDIASIVSEPTKQVLHEILSAETGEQAIYRLVEAMTNRQGGKHFENNLALLNALYLGFNETYN